MGTRRISRVLFRSAFNLMSTIPEDLPIWTQDVPVLTPFPIRIPDPFPLPTPLGDGEDSGDESDTDNENGDTHQRKWSCVNWFYYYMTRGCTRND